MDAFRPLNLRRPLSLFILFVSLFSQIQTVYACDSMTDKPKHICCCGEHDSAMCPMADHCGMSEQLAQTPCCEVSYDLINDTAMMGATSTVDLLTLLLDSPQPPPDSALSRDATVITPALRPHLLHPITLPPALPGNATYLLTRRLRL